MMREETVKEKITANYQGLSPAHGNTVAAWALVLIVIFGALIAAIGFCIPQIILFWTGVVVMIAGFISGFVLRRMGYGVITPEKFVSEEEY